MNRWTAFLLVAAAVLLAVPQGAHALREFEPGITLVDTDELKMMIDRKDDMLLVNTLTPVLFRDSAIPGSVNLPYERLLSGKISFPEDRDREMVFYCLGYQ